jgi:hypothetical protein
MRQNSTHHYPILDKLIAGAMLPMQIHIPAPLRVYTGTAGDGDRSAGATVGLALGALCAAASGD